MDKQRRVIALGFFDGVHLGHGALLRRVAQRASPASTRVRMWVEEIVTPSSSTLGITSQPIPSWTHLSASRRGLPSPL